MNINTSLCLLICIVSCFSEIVYKRIFTYLKRDFVPLFRNVDIFSGRSQRVSMAGVPPELNVIPTALPTTPPPTLPPPTCGNPYPPLRNSSGEDEARLEGTDYIAFSADAEVLNYTRTR